jgi:hypothetical protein
MDAIATVDPFAANAISSTVQLSSYLKAMRRVYKRGVTVMRSG